MPTESIVFAPDIDERQLDRETEQVNDQLQQVGQDVPVTFDPEEMDGLAPAGGGGIGGDGGGVGQAAGVGALASRIPKPIAGVTAGTALPVALAGGVGIGMLDAMHSASARLQTSTTILRQAWNSVWRALGDRLDELFVRDLFKDVADSLFGISDAIRSGDLFGGLGSLNDLFFEGQSGNILSAMFPGGLSLRLVNFIHDELSSLNWNNITAGILDLWPGWPDIGDLWPGWPDLGELWPGWPNIKVDWPGWPNITTQWNQIGWPNVMQEWNNIGWPNVTQQWNNIGWPNVKADWPGWPDGINPGDIVGRVFPSINASQILDRITGGGGGNGNNTGNGDTGGNGGFDPDLDPTTPGNQDIDDIVSLQGGGRVERGGVARVHRGELVADPDRLVRDLANAVDTATGGGGGTVDISSVERKLDTLHRDLQRLAGAMDNLTIETDRETIGRVAQEGLRDGNNDTDPLA